MRLDAELLEMREWKRDVSTSIDAIARHLGIEDVTGLPPPIAGYLPSVVKRQTKNNLKSTLVVTLDETQEALVLEATSTYLRNGPRKDMMNSRGKSVTGSAEHESRKWLEGIISIIEDAASFELGEDARRTLTSRLASMTEDKKQATCIYFTKATPEGQTGLKRRASGQEPAGSFVALTTILMLHRTQHSVRRSANGLLKVRVGANRQKISVTLSLTQGSTGIDPALYPQDTSQESTWQLSVLEEKRRRRAANYNDRRRVPTRLPRLRMTDNSTSTVVGFRRESLGEG
ncbi:MAG: hypothetical protein Q9226_000841 [Calogaya cf. arnoldii]